MSPNRLRDVPLERKRAVSGSIFVFVTSEEAATRVRFFLDHADDLLEDPQLGGTPYSVDMEAPYDFTGTAADGSAQPFDTAQLPNGPHMITAAIDFPDGSTEVLVSRFVVHSGQPTLVFDADTLRFKLHAGERSSRPMNVFTTNGIDVTYTVSTDAPWLSIAHTGGDTADMHSVSADASRLAPGNYTATITASANGHAAASLPVTLTVKGGGAANDNGSRKKATGASSRSQVDETSSGTVSIMAVDGSGECTPVPCEDVKVTLPYELGFSKDHGYILDGNNVGTGFTWYDKPTNAIGYLPQNLTVNTAAPGTMSILTTKGLMSTTSNAQDNAVAVGIDAASQISILETTVLNPPAGTGKYEQAGLWFGNNEDNYVKMIVMSDSTGTKIQYNMEVNGSTVGAKTSAAINLTGASTTLSLRANPSTQEIEGFYSINGGPASALGKLTAPPEFFSFDAAGIDPRIGTRSFGGIFASHRNAASSLTYTFDSFSVKGERPQDSGSSGASGDFGFDRVTFPVVNPTSMVWGPDNRLYVTEMYGTIHAITLDDATKQVIADEVIKTLGSRLTLGITVDPQSTPDNVILWLAHSNPSADKGEVNSGMVTRLSGPGFTTREDVITGLPRALANHSINSLHFGPDGRLYVVIGGNTGAGAPNTASSEFGTRAEQPLSAAMLVADIRAVGFDGTCATPELSYGPAPCSVQVYAGGLRNSYDFVHHSNGQIYATDNGLGVTGTYPSTPSSPCEGYANPALWTQGGHNPGEQPDLLLRVEQGKQYGHPNQYRSECVFKNGSWQSVSAPANYAAPFYVLGEHTSSNGIIEYRSEAFNGRLKGQLLIANYSQGDDIRRVKLSADGLSVVESKQLVCCFSNPLPVAEGPDGTLYVGEHGGNQVSALTPKNTGTWTAKPSLPLDMLDLGGAALNGKFYVVAGKTSTGPKSSMHIYDPAAQSWTTGPNKPGPAVENPAVVAYNGKLYVFAGSTDPFSGAVANATVFDPATNTWTALAPMPTARGGTTAQVIGDKIYVVGGMDGSGASVANLEIYNPASNTWSSGVPMATRRDNPGSAALGDKLYIFGGRTRDANGTTINGTLNTVEMYDPATNTWTPRAAMPTGRRTFVVGTLNGHAQVMGGEVASGGATFPQNEDYDPATNTWTSLSSMTTGRHGPAAATIDGVVYVAGGGIKGGSSFSGIHEAFSFAGNGMGPDTTKPLVTSVTPSNTATEVPVGSNAGAIFSEKMDAVTVNASTFTLVKQGTTAPVAAAVTYNETNKTATLDPDAILDAQTTYVATIKGGASGAKDLAGNPLAADRVWSFTTAVPDTTAPVVTGIAPAHEATNVGVTGNVLATFSELMDAVTVNGSTFTLVKQGTTTPVAAAVTYNASNKMATLNPDADLEGQTTYVATVKGGASGAKDLAGNPVGETTWTFRTSVVPVPGGLQGEYYDNQDFTNLKLTRVDPTVNFNWGSGTPDPAIAVDSFSVRWTGQVKADFSEVYTFYTTSNDGVRLWINNQLVINNWTDHSATEDSGTVKLEAGQWYPITLEFYEGSGSAVTSLSYSSQSTPKQIIPADHLSSTAVADTVAPAVTSIVPTENATGVAAGENATVSFSEGMDPGTVNASTFTLVKQGAMTQVASAVTYDALNRKATLNPDADLELGATYVATVKGGASGAKDLAGNPLAADKTWSFSTSARVTGLTGAYYDNQDFTNLKLTRVDPTVNFSWDKGSPDPTIGVDTFSVRWTGKVKADINEVYTFYTTSNDGVRLWVNNQLLIDNWTAHSAKQNSGTIALQAGQWYTIKLEYYDGTGISVITLSYSSPSTPKQIIPSDHLEPQ